MENWIQRSKPAKPALDFAEFWDDTLSQQQNLEQINFWLRRNDALRDAMQIAKANMDQSA